MIWFPSQPAFERKPFVSSFQGDLYVKNDATWEEWLRTGELKYLRKVPPSKEKDS